MTEEKSKSQVSKRVEDYLIRAHSFQELGTEELPNEDYDVLHFPQMLFAIGIVICIYAYYIIYISTTEQTFIDGFVALVVGNIVATIGLLRLVKGYWKTFAIFLLISISLITLMLGLWYYFISPAAKVAGILPMTLEQTDPFLRRTAFVILTTTTFAYIACFIWFLVARYTSALYFYIFSRGAQKKNKFFIVDPWRKSLSKKIYIITDILKRVRYPFLFLLTIILTLSGFGSLYFIEIDWQDYFETVLLMYILLCAMVILFPAFWLLDYVRYYNEDRLEVRSIGRQVLILVKGYCGFGIIFTFINRGQKDIWATLLDLYMLSMFLIPTLIILIGSYVLLTERDVFYIAEKVPHGDKVIVDYKLIDSKGKELKWWVDLTKTKDRGEKT